MYNKSDVFLNSLLKGERAICSEIVNNSLKNEVSFFEIYENIFRPTLYKVGELWEYNQISVATEHLASAIIEGLMNQVYTSINKKPISNHKIVLSSIENEHHQIGLRMVNDVFESNGWETYFLGANTPVKELVNFLKVVNPDILAISLSIYFHIPVFQNLLEIIKVEFPNLKVIVGGQAFNHVGVEVIEKYHNVAFLRNLRNIDFFIKNI